MYCRSLARIGTAYQKKGDLKNALTFLNKSLSEHRDQDVVKKAQEVGALLCMELGMSVCLVSSFVINYSTVATYLKFS